MIRFSRIFTILAAILFFISILVIAYIWIGFSVFGINTSRLDPEQGPAWPMTTSVLAFFGSIVCLIVGFSLKLATVLRSK